MATRLTNTSKTFSFSFFSSFRITQKRFTRITHGFEVREVSTRSELAACAMTALWVTASSTPRALDPYREIQLPDPNTHIRLLELIKPPYFRAASNDIRCRLRITVWPIKSAPPYHAVSYAWGVTDSIATCTDDVNRGDEVLHVRQNCFDVLRQLKYLKQSRYYWIDALCIHQASEFEKNAQVAMMGEIFEKAEHVLVCVGLCRKHEAEYAMRMIDELEKRCAARSDFMARDPSLIPRKDHDSRTLEEVSDAHLKHVTSIYNVLGKDIKRFMLSLVDLSERPYFGRLWVFQELLLARRASICCGRQLQPVATVEYYLRMACWTKFFLSADLPYKDIRPPRVINPHDWPGNIAGILAQQQLHINNQAVTLLGEHISSNGGDIGTKVRRYRFSHPSESVHYAKSLHCADKRDTVYGMLALIHWSGRKSIKPRYHISVFDLAVEFLKYGCDLLSARQLMLNLELNMASTDVRHGVALRQRICATLYQTTVISYLTSPRDMVTASWLGRQVTQCSASSVALSKHPIFPSLCEEIFYTVQLFDALGTATACVASSLCWGDWIVFEPSLLPHGLILRDVGACFAIVGRAYGQWEIGSQEDWWIERKTSEQKSFSVCFDALDYIVFAANTPTCVDSVIDDTKRLAQDVRNSLSTGICKHEFSSYAKAE